MLSDGEEPRSSSTQNDDYIIVVVDEINGEKGLTISCHNNSIKPKTKFTIEFHRR